MMSLMKSWKSRSAEAEAGEAALDEGVVSFLVEIAAGAGRRARERAALEGLQVAHVVVHFLSRGLDAEFLLGLVQHEAAGKEAGHALLLVGDASAQGVEEGKKLGS